MENKIKGNCASDSGDPTVKISIQLTMEDTFTLGV